MAGATRLSIRTIAALAVVGTATVFTKVNLKALLLNTVTGPGSVSRIVALLLVVANLKSLPFVWHIRVFSTLIKHIYFGTHKFSNKGNGPAALFQPIITASRSPFMECDYNFHKSNSTYFSDLDVSRSNLVCCLLHDGIRKLNTTPQVVIAPDGVPAKGPWSIMLGAVHCSFKREIAPYEPYEMWSRILCWDRKWIYVVSHFVKKGAVKPAGYSVNPPSTIGSVFGSKAKAKGNSVNVDEKELVTQVEEMMNGYSTSTSTSAIEPKIPHQAIFSSAISKYVMKLGRLTVHPEVVIEASGLLPPRPGGWNTMSEPKQGDGEAALSSPVVTHDIKTVDTNGVTINREDIWDWRRVEAENAQGMELAKHFIALDGLHETFTGGRTPALGFYRDVI